MSEFDLLPQQKLTITQEDALGLEDMSSGDDNNSSINDKRIYAKQREPDIAPKQVSSFRPYITPKDMQKWFGDMELRQDGKMQPKELQQAFEIFQGRHFSDSACKFVVRLFDLDQNGGLDIKEFELLYYHIKQWVTAFNAYDVERTGFLDEAKLDFALKHMDIHFSPEFVRYLIQRNDPNATKMPLDKFIVTCIQIQRYTDEFKQRDLEFTGHINVKYEDFLEMVMKCSVV